MNPPDANPWHKPLTVHFLLLQVQSPEWVYKLLNHIKQIYASIYSCSLTSHPDRGSRVPHVSKEPQLRRGRWRSSDCCAATSTPSTPGTKTQRGALLITHSLHRKPFEMILNNTTAWHPNKCEYLHTALWILDGVVQQALEPTLEGPALLHQRLVTTDTPTGIHADSQHRS